MAESDKAMALIAPHCDIEDRLRSVPPSARVRGMWFKVITDQLKERGLFAEYESYFPSERHFGIRYYWLGDFLVRLAVGGALIGGVHTLHDGIFEIARGNAVAFAKTSVGKTLLLLLSRDPVKLAKQGAAARRQTTTYGRWWTEFPAPDVAEMHAESEYIWIESYMRGAAQGTYESVGISAETSAKLHDRFNGLIQIEW